MGSGGNDRGRSQRGGTKPSTRGGESQNSRDFHTRPWYGPESVVPEANPANTVLRSQTGEEVGQSSYPLRRGTYLSVHVGSPCRFATFLVTILYSKPFTHIYDESTREPNKFTPYHGREVPLNTGHNDSEDGYSDCVDFSYVPGHRSIFLTTSSFTKLISLDIIQVSFALCPCLGSGVT